MQTEAIKEIQHYLRTLSFRNPRIPFVAVDGIYGSDTALAVSVFQDSVGLPVNGVTDPVTWDRLVGAFRDQQSTVIPLRVLENNVSLINRSSPKDLVGILQSMLFQLAGRYQNLTAPSINGSFDEQTENSIKQFKKLQGLSSDSIVDADTWNVLASLYNARTTQSTAP